MCYQCDEGLICWQRVDGEAVPGCTGELASRNPTTDFCVFEKHAMGFNGDDEGDDVAPVVDGPWNTTTGGEDWEMPSKDPATDMPTEEIVDEDWPVMAVEAETSAPDPAMDDDTDDLLTPITDMDDDEPGAPEITGELEMAGQNGQGNFPLGLCQGDCDNDGEVSVVFIWFELHNPFLHWQ